MKRRTFLKAAMAAIAGGLSVLVASTNPVNIVHAGKRGGKTELLKNTHYHTGGLYKRIMITNRLENETLNLLFTPPLELKANTKYYIALCKGGLNEISVG